MEYLIPITPVPASRPRVSKWGTYYGKVYKAFMELFPQVCPEPEECLQGNLYVETEFVCRRPQKVTRECPVGDNDNYEKALWDAMTKMGFWGDDDQIVYNTTYKRYAEVGEDPHIKVEVYKYEG